MTTPHVHCLSHLPTAHEAAPTPEGAAGDEHPRGPANRPLARRSPVEIGPLSASLPRSASCLIPRLR